MSVPHPPWPTTFPEFSTARLRLRAPVPLDAPALLAILGDSDVTRYHNIVTFTTVAEAQAAIERLRQGFAARDAIRWAMELLKDGEMIGTVGLLHFDFEHRRAELGYEIGRRWWGQGLTPEAVAAVVRYGFSVLRLHRIEAGVLPANAASVRVLQKLGFVDEGMRRDYFYSKGQFHCFRWFSLLETDPLRDPDRAFP